ncbi:MAG: hypothetical protein WDZ30_09205, partial [Cellvibrionaceae bacterium]
MLIRLCVIPALAMLTACQTPPQTQELLNRNERLQVQLEEAKAQIDALTAERNSKQEDIEDLNRVITVLNTEKSSRVQESSGLRSRVRGF